MKKFEKVDWNSLDDNEQAIPFSVACAVKIRCTAHAHLLQRRGLAHSTEDGLSLLLIRSVAAVAMRTTRYKLLFFSILHAEVYAIFCSTELFTNLKYFL